MSESAAAALRSRATMVQRRRSIAKMEQFSGAASAQFTGQVEGRIDKIQG
jgi:hypothetical protein